MRCLGSDLFFSCVSGFEHGHMDCKQPFPAAAFRSGEVGRGAGGWHRGTRHVSTAMEGLEYFPESLRTFRGQVSGMLELYFEPLARRSTDAYAEAFARYYGEMKSVEGIFGEGPFEQSFPMENRFVPMVHPTEKGRCSWRSKRSFPISRISCTRIFTVG
jgi:hypothetical protein